MLGRIALILLALVCYTRQDLVDADKNGGCRTWCNSEYGNSGVYISKTKKCRCYIDMEEPDTRLKPFTLNMKKEVQDGEGL